MFFEKQSFTSATSYLSFTDYTSQPHSSLSDFFHSPSHLNSIKEFFSALRWKVYDFKNQALMPLIQAMEDAYDLIDAAVVQRWIRHSRQFQSSINFLFLLLSSLGSQGSAGAYRIILHLT